MICQNIIKKMSKYKNYFYQSEENNSEKTRQVSKNNKVNHNSIINKIHSIQESISSNGNQPKYPRKKNNYRKISDPWEQENQSRSKSNNKMRSKSRRNYNAKNKIINISQDLSQSKNNKINQLLNYNNSITEQSNCSNNTNNSFFTNNTSNNGINANHNIIITINNYNKITPPNIEQSSKTIPIQKSKDRNYKDHSYKKRDIKTTKYVRNIENNKSRIKNNNQKNREESDKRISNYYMNGNNLSIDNNSPKLYNNNIFNQIRNNNNCKTNNDNIDNNDNISINTYNTINESNNNINSSNNTSNREYSSRTLIKKNKNYQDNIILKKKQLGMYSPLSFLKRNFEIPTKNVKDNKYINNINSFNTSENKNKYDESLNTNIDNDINDKNNNTDEDIDNKNKKHNININNEKKDNNDITKNKYNFNYYNINKSKYSINSNDDNNSYKDSNIPLETNPNNNNNKNQVKNIISTINRIKNTKQIYNNKKAFAFTKIHRKREKMPLYSINNSSFLRSKNSYSRLVERNINNHFFYSRSNSKNVLNNRNKSVNQKYYNFSQKRTSKSNQKLLDRSFMSETDKLDKKNSTNELLLSCQKKRNKMYVFKNIDYFNNIKSEYTYNEHDKKRSNPDIIDSMTLNTSINSSNNNYFNINNKKSNDNNRMLLNKNNTSNIRSISTDIQMRTPNYKRIIDDTYESTTIANINKHCDNLLFRINQKMKEEKEKEKQRKDSQRKTDENQSDDDNDENDDNDDNDNDENDKEQNKDIYKKIVTNASLCRRGLNRPDETTKINQDTLFKVKFGDINYSYYGVCDGHGPSGHFVSDFIKSHIAFIVYKHLKILLLQNKKNSLANLNEADDSYIDFIKLFKNCFLIMDTKLNDNKNIDIELSGTTCVSLLFCDNRIISANVGDSRAIKGYYNSNKKEWNYIALSRDHKPSDKDESERIKNNKGIIHPYVDDDGNYAGPDRVWIDDELPGLAMSRSFGDEIATRVGVFSEPEVKIFPFKEEDKFVVIGSDGLWEYVTNDEVIDIVSEYYEKNDCDGAVSKLYEISHERWVNYDDYIDDISIIVVFLD